MPWRNPQHAWVDPLLLRSAKKTLPLTSTMPECVDGRLINIPPGASRRTGKKRGRASAALPPAAREATEAYRGWIHSGRLRERRWRRRLQRPSEDSVYWAVPQEEGPEAAKVPALKPPTPATQTCPCSDNVRQHLRPPERIKGPTHKI